MNEREALTEAFAESRFWLDRKKLAEIAAPVVAALVAQARSDAWDEGYATAIRAALGSGPYVARDPGNPYRIAAASSHPTGNQP